MDVSLSWSAAVVVDGVFSRGMRAAWLLHGASATWVPTLPAILFPPINWTDVRVVSPSTNATATTATNATNATATNGALDDAQGLRARVPFPVTVRLEGIIKQEAAAFHAVGDRDSLALSGHEIPWRIGVFAPGQDCAEVSEPATVSANVTELANSDYRIVFKLVASNRVDWGGPHA